MRVVGVDIGGTKIAVSTDEPRAEALIAPTPRGAEAIIAAVLELVRDAAGGEPFAGVGVGTAGTVDATGAIAAATDLIPGWSGTPLAARLAEELSVPVVVLNDVHAVALGEAVSGAGRGFDRVLVAATGTGLGGAFVRDGVLDAGSHGAAGSLGHIPLPGLERICSCGLPAHAEPYASGPGMERTFAEAGGSRMALPAIGELARAGDRRAIDAIASGGQALGRALSVAATIADPDVIVVGGGPASLGELLLGPARERFRAEVPSPPLRQVPIVPAAFGPHAAIHGAQVAIRGRLAMQLTPGSPSSAAAR
ncbi:MAG: ROK family protein [Microbacteriaceae bacterium]|nr:ROK family protein [Microbacteriaceae bacterium]